MDVPTFLFDLLNQQLQTIQEGLLTKVAARYQLDVELLKQEFLESLTLVPEKTEKVIICKKQKGRRLPGDEHRCNSRIWNRGKGGQCTRFRKEGAEFCCQHIEKRKHGIIHDDPPKEVFQHNTKILYK